MEEGTQGEGECEWGERVETEYILVIGKLRESKGVGKKKTVEEKKKGRLLIRCIRTRERNTENERENI